MNKKMLTLGCVLIFVGTAINVEKALSNYNLSKNTSLLRSTGTDDESTKPQCDGYRVYCQMYLKVTPTTRVIECLEDGSLGILGLTGNYKKGSKYCVSADYGTCTDSKHPSNICVKSEQGLIRVHSVTEDGTAIK